MGGEPYFYFVPWQKNLQNVLDDLRNREFKAGRYNPVIPSLSGFENDNYLSKKPGAKHASIDEAREAADASGTRSILDIERIGPEADYGVAAPVDAATLKSLFGTDKPASKAVRKSVSELLSDIDRGQCKYLIIFEKDKPAEVCFFGYSFD